MDFAILKGAKIINCSFGGYQFVQAEEDAFRRARNAGVLVVAAAGNDSNDNDAFAFYPASYALDNIISVAALDRRDGLAAFSNYGRTNVHVAAPGVEILSTHNAADNAYQTRQGTSMAAPYVTGVVALVLSYNGPQSISTMRERIIETSKRIQSLSGYVYSNGLVDPYNAVLGQLSFDYVWAK